MRKALIKSYLRRSRIPIFRLFLVSFTAEAPADDQGGGEEEKPPYLAYFDPDEGFKPVQGSMAEVFLQLAGSMEYCGSPIPYMKHIAAEHERVNAKYRKKYNRDPVSNLPPHMDVEYFSDLDKNWEILKDKLGLERLSREIGRLVREGIKGQSGQGTIVINMLNRHQELIYDDMTSGEIRVVGSKRLRAELAKLLEPGKAWTASVMAEAEEKLTDPERQIFQTLMGKKRFAKSDFALLEEFYDSGHDRLSEYGKDQLSQRIWAGQRGEDISTASRNQAEIAAIKINELISDRCNYLDQHLGEDNKPKKWLRLLVYDISWLLNSEFEAAVIDWAGN